MPGSGRKKGTPNKTKGKAALIAEAHAQGLEMPLDFLLRVMRNQRNPIDMRINAAKAAAPYCHRALKAVDMNIDGTVTVEIVD